MRAKDLALIALFAALTALMGMSPVIPLPVVGITISIQTLGMLLAGGIIGSKRGALSLLLFIVLVAVGLPVLTGAQGGFGKLIGPTAGFIWSWPIGAFLVGLLVELWWKKLNYLRALVAAVIGSVSLYVLGHTWLAISTSMPLKTALWSWVAYLPGDLIKSVVAAGVIIAVKKAYPLITPKAPKGQESA
ncbi:MAG: biotin transporter BioY [Propionibacteriaceae bacterium]|jgi:biotin transport system substrate-specific component|nr:biotin transporter BioY [Propionibacteriaceae bacterium]